MNWYLLFFFNLIVFYFDKPLNNFKWAVKEIIKGLQAVTV